MNKSDLQHTGWYLKCTECSYKMTKDTEFAACTECDAPREKLEYHFLVTMTMEIDVD